jgi:hypothetical protein
MPFIDITPPPGVVKPGTIYDAKGRWYDTKWVRWYEGVMQAIGGFEAVQISGGQVFGGERISGTHSWRENTGIPLLAWGGPTEIKVMRGGAIYDVTPAGFTGGSGDAAITSGNYGTGLYGANLYGVGDTAIETLQEAQSFQMDNYGEDLFFVAASDGKLWFVDQDGSAGDPATAVEITPSTGSVPTSNVGVVITPERFVMLLGAGGDGRAIQWPDQDDYTDWLASATNQAGDIQLPGKGIIMAGRRAQAETLIWTSLEIFSLRYIGGNFIYQAVPVGDQGAISRRSMAIVGSVAYWMGPRGFYIYNGYTQAIDSPLADYVFTNLNVNQVSKIWAETRKEFGEITWHYPAGDDTECSRSVTYNYNDGFWYNNTVNRVAGEDTGAFDYPMAFDSAGRLWRHETGSFYGYEEDGWESTTGNSGVPFIKAGGEFYGYTDLSEFALAEGHTAVVTNQNIGFIGKPAALPAVAIRNNAALGNYLLVDMSLAADVAEPYAYLFDEFNGLVTNGVTQKIEVLSRQYNGLFDNASRYSGGAAFLAGSDDTDICGLGSGMYHRNSGDYEVGVQISDLGSTSVWANGDVDEWAAQWYWCRWRITQYNDVGPNDDVYIKAWIGGLDDEPDAWTATSINTLGRNTQAPNAGTKFGFLIVPISAENDDHGISYFAFSSDWDTPEPSDVDLTLVKPEATTGPIELGKGDNVMHVQELIPDEKTLGDVDMYLRHSFYPTDTETEVGPYTAAQPTDVRLVARQMRLKIIEDQPGWRLGTVRADVEAGGQR